MFIVNNIEAIIFDFDGVLVNTEPIYFKAIKRVMENYDLILPNSYIQKLVGYSTEQNILDIKNDFKIHFDNDEVCLQLSNMNRQLIENTVINLQKGILDLIDFGKSVGLKFGICSNASKYDIDKIFDNTLRTTKVNLVKHFASIITKKDVSQLKPHPESYLLSANNLLIEPGHCLVIEDSLAGILAAKAAGCTCFGLRHPYNEHIDFSYSDKVIHSIAEVEKLIRNHL